MALVGEADGVEWERANTLGSPEGYRQYLALFPRGLHWPDAASALAGLQIAELRRPVTGFTGRRIRVTADGKGDYPTLALAVAAARDGDRIVLGSGTHRSAPFEIKKSILIEGPPANRPPAIVKAALPPGYLFGFFTVSDGSSRIERVSFECPCEGVFVMVANLSLIQVNIDTHSSKSPISVAVSVGDMAHLSMTGGSIVGGSAAMSVLGDAVVTDSRIQGPVTTVSGGNVAFVGNRFSGFGNTLLRHSSSGTALLERNIVDAGEMGRGDSWVPVSLLYINELAGPGAIRSNQVQVPKAFDPSKNMFQCRTQQNCVVVATDNRWTPAPATQPARGAPSSRKPKPTRKRSSAR